MRAGFFAAAIPMSAAAVKAVEIPPVPAPVANSPSTVETGPPPDSRRDVEWAVGVRYGFPVDNDFALTELYGVWFPPDVYYDFNDDFRLRVGLTAGGGALADDHNDLAMFFHAGPVAELVHRPSGLRIVGRSEPAYMSRHALGGVDLGEDFQFVSSLGLYWFPPSNIHWGFGVAIQHISNAGIDDVNPGTNHVVFSVGFEF